MIEKLEADPVVIGSGAIGLAFTDELLTRKTLRPRLFSWIDMPNQAATGMMHIGLCRCINRHSTTG